MQQLFNCYRNVDFFLRLLYTAKKRNVVIKVSPAAPPIRVYIPFLNTKQNRK